jgi:hypothetical protein
MIMKKMKLFLVFSVLALGVWGCLTDGANFVGPDGLAGGDQSSGAGKEYIYSGYDADGIQIIKGVLNLVIDDSNRVTGTWTLQLMVRDSLGRYGPQVGSGNLVGGIEGDKIGLGLNPDYVDNNVLLAGTIAYWGIYGTWEYVGFPGVLNNGTFRAVRSD